MVQVCDRGQLELQIVLVAAPRVAKIINTVSRLLPLPASEMLPLESKEQSRLLRLEDVGCIRGPPLRVTMIGVPCLVALQIIWSPKF